MLCRACGYQRLKTWTVHQKSTDFADGCFPAQKSCDWQIKWHGVFLFHFDQISHSLIDPRQFKHRNPNGSNREQQSIWRLDCRVPHDLALNLPTASNRGVSVDLSPEKASDKLSSNRLALTFPRCSFQDGRLTKRFLLHRFTHRWRASYRQMESHLKFPRDPAVLAQVADILKEVEKQLDLNVGLFLKKSIHDLLAWTLKVKLWCVKVLYLYYITKRYGKSQAWSHR